MNRLLSFFFVWTVSIFLFSCKKSNDTPNPADQLKNTAWAGEFKYTAGANTETQGFSLQLNNDSLVTWSDLTSTRPGGTWKMEGDRITVLFPNKTGFSATVGKDAWSGFSNIGATGILLDNLSKTTVPVASQLDNVTFTGNVATSAYKMVFQTGNKVAVSIGAGTPVVCDYSIRGAGIYFEQPTIIYRNTSYGAWFSGTSTFRGILVSPSFFSTSYSRWVAGK